MKNCFLSIQAESSIEIKALKKNLSKMKANCFAFIRIGIKSKEKEDRTMRLKSKKKSPKNKQLKDLMVLENVHKKNMTGT